MNQKQKRQAFIDGHPAKYYDCNRHPDCRMVRCPSELIENSEWITRSGLGFVCIDGAYYDPCSREFIGIKTTN